MKGVLLAGGLGTRLYPVTEVTNKHLLPVYDRPMVFHPLETLLNAGIKDIMIVSGPEHAGAFLRLLKNGKQFGANFTFRVQDGNGGIAEALSLAEEFVGSDDVAVILGDNIFEDNFKEAVDTFKSGARLFLKEVSDPGRFGVAELSADGKKVLNIVEKPKNPKSNWAVTGFYIYDARVFDVIRTLKPSDRNELEITDVSNYFVERNEVDACFLTGRWTDAGTFESLFKASEIARDRILGNLDRHHQDLIKQGLATHFEDVADLYPKLAL
jgi:glucose-1-phosphate thymidylyltransferase